VQVVEDHQHGLIGSEAIERAADRLDQRRTVRGRGRRPELGQEHRQVPHQRRGRVEGPGPGAQARAQRGDHRPVGRAARLAGCAAENERVVFASDQLGDQAALADACVAADEDDAAGAAARALHRGDQLRQLSVASEEGPTGRHGPSLRAVRPRWTEIRHADREIRQSHGCPAIRPDVASLRNPKRGSAPRRSEVMNLYVIARRNAWATADDLKQAAARSAAEGDKEGSGVRWIRSYVISESSGELGTVCIYEADDPEALREHAGAVPMPADEIIPVVDTVVVRPDPVPTAAS
jgi:hypothetical protein